MLLALAQGADTQLRHKKIEPDFSHGNQPRVVPVLRQRSVQAVQVIVLRTADVQGVNAQAIAVATRMGQLAHCIEVANLDRRQHAMNYIIYSCLRTFYKG